MIELVRIADRPPVPWKNGAGTTRELWARRDGAGNALIRISIAEISGAQDFSAFPGIDRVILQLDGPPMVLTIDGTSHPLAPLSPLPFAGEARVACRMDGPGLAHDLNLMCQRSAFRPVMRRWTALAAQRMKAGGKDVVTALLALEPCVINLPMPVRLSALDLLVVAGHFTLETSTPADLILLEAWPVAL